MIHRVHIYLYQPFFFYTTHISPTALTGNTFLCNLPWQGENISIKRRLLWQTSLVLDNLSDWAVFLSAQLVLISFHSLCCALFFCFVLLSFTSTNSPLFLPDQYFCSTLKYLYVWGCLFSLTQTLSPFCPAASVNRYILAERLLTLMCSSGHLMNTWIIAHFRVVVFFAVYVLSCLTFYSSCLHRCTMPVFTSGWMEVSSDGQAQYHW